MPAEHLRFFHELAGKEAWYRAPNPLATSFSRETAQIFMGMGPVSRFILSCKMKPTHVARSHAGAPHCGPHCHTRTIQPLLPYPTYHQLLPPRVLLTPRVLQPPGQAQGSVHCQVRRGRWEVRTLVEISWFYIVIVMQGGDVSLLLCGLTLRAAPHTVKCVVACEPRPSGV